MGRYLTRELLLQLLVTRLRVEALSRRRPEVLAAPVRAPLVIAGLPRSGTTHLHGTIACDPGLRSLPYYESLEPVPASLRAPDPGQTDPRLARCERALRFQHWVMPLFPAMHEMTPEAPHEELQLLAAAFSTMLFEAMFPVPSYRDWYLAADQTPAYVYLRRVLQLLQALRGPQRWVLKSPQHLEQLPVLLRVFPDARIVQTHRDPVRVTASMTTMAAYGLRMNCGASDPRAVGAYWADRIERMLRANVRDRGRVARDAVLDVRYDELMGDPDATLARVYEFAGLGLGDDARDAMRSYREAHPRGRHGSLHYRLEDFGVDPAERRRALGFYSEHFGVVAEP